MGVHEIGGWIARYSMQYLANSLWQLPLLTAAGWVVSRLVRPLGAAIQHRVWAATLMLSVLAPLGGLMHGAAGAEVLLGPAYAFVAVPQKAFGSSAGAWGAFSLPPPLYWALFFAYVAFLFCAGARLALCWRKAHRLGRNSARAELSKDAAELWQECCRAFAVGDASLRCSGAIAGPATVGHWKPCLLFPESFLSNSSRDDLLAALAHECAHVERRDFLHNLLYEAAALPIAFHPAMWMVKARIAGTRELICDSMAAERLAGSHAYAQSLLRLAAAIGAEACAVPPYAIGMFDANTLENRIMNLVESLPSPSRRKAYALRLVAISVLSLAGIAALALAVSVEPAGAAQAAIAEPPAGKIYKLGDGAGHPCSAATPHCVISPQLVYAPDPEFPKEELHKKVKFDSVCIVGVVVDAQGRPQQVHIVRMLRPDFDQEAMKAVEQYKFKPAIRDGKPVVVEVNIEVNFRRN